MSHDRVKKHISRLMALLLAAVLILGAVPTAAAAEGSCGNDLSWSYDSGRLVITGSGAMTNYTEDNMAPWYDLREEITRIELPEGLTTVGDLAFYGCTAVESLQIPNSVTKIGDFAFSHCTGLTFLSLSQNLSVIGRSAFESCESLTSVRLPNTLTTIGFHGFYRCASLTGISVPASVTSLGGAAFAYCASMVQAQVYATIERIPQWLFYGCYNLVAVTLGECITGVDTYGFRLCDSLSSVECLGPAAYSAQVKADIERDREESVHISATPNTGSASNTLVSEGENSLVVSTTSGVQTDNAEVGSVVTETYPLDGSAGETSTQVDAVIERQEGWSDLAGVVADALEHNSGRTESGHNAGSVNVNVYLYDEVEVTAQVLEQFAGQSVNLTIYTPDGSRWSIDCTQLTAGAVTDSVDLSYQLTAAGEAVCGELGVTAAYLLTFRSDAEVNAEVLIRLPVAFARQTATLYQRADKTLERLQASVVDDRGYAHFYLASVDADMEYVIGINVPAETSEEAIIPSTLTQEMGVEQFQQTEYIITGRTSSWGLNFGQVTWILAGVMVGAVVIVGVIMFVLNKRKLKRGYVPDLGEDEDDE